MSVEHTHGRKEIILGEDIRLIVTSKSEEYYFWDEVVFESPDGEIKIGSYSTGAGSGRQWMKYNSDYVAIVSFNPISIGLSVNKLFHIPSRQMVDDSDLDKLLEIYNQEFESPSDEIKKIKK